MNVNNQLSTLRQSIRLKELGISQDNIFDWVELVPDNGSSGKTSFYPKYCAEILTTPYIEMCSAFTESELAVMLDAYYETYKTYHGTWDCEGFEDKHRANGFKTPCEASAEALIHHLETNEAFTADSCNKRLTGLKSLNTAYNEVWNGKQG